ncbi:hypothetical protein EYC80_002173 [Monilinia laxa]|uniref:Helicase ATP-binding domain-containing protein n=1 Tax=Monilinia laxa TaxID=61186 RepID=A0A5N6K343_MONLA|nr:hypothetical protein EYC80_002173 [Monilinia laxa]
MVYNKSLVTRVLREHVQKSYARINFFEPWRNLPEIPTSEEILQDVSWQHNNALEQPLDYQKLAEPKEFDPRLPHNNIDGAWDSKEQYLGFHYRILREDAVAPLRQAVADFKRNYRMSDAHDTTVYTDVYLVGIQLSPFGPAFRIEFSSDRAGKRIRWEQSSRLTPGSLVCLSPSSDMFRSICKVGTVAARPLVGGLDRDPPQIDIFFGDYEDVILNPSESFVMIQSRLGFFEAYRHVLVALQKLTTEESPYIEKYLVQMDKIISTPDHLKERPFFDLRSIALSSEERLSGLTDEEEENLCHVNLLKGVPTLPKSGMDDSQLTACQRMLTQSLAIVQGPPGTGKTFTSVQALKVMLSNRRNGPIIVAAQTNHALDQLLTHIADFEDNFVRLGGRCDRGNATILARTLYELRLTTKDLKASHFSTVRAPSHEDLLTGKTLLECDILSQEHYDSFYEAGWSGSGNVDDADDTDPLPHWLGNDQMTRMQRTPVINKNLEIEDPDQESEQLQEVEVEVQSKDNEESLSGTWIPLRRGLTGKTTNRRATGKKDPKNILAKTGSLFDIPVKHRGAVYCYWEKLYYDQLTRKLIEKLANYQNSMDTLKMTKWARDVEFIDHLDTRVIGCTTTGLSKYRGLLSALNPSVLLIEEAAETLEANVTASIIPSLEQVILVGDHRQLTANTTLDRFMSHPYHMSISLFERLVNNGMSYTMLNKQRRMIPEVRELLCIQPNPFYVDLDDHYSVLDRVVHRPPVPGMAVDSYFFAHNWQEHRDVNMSCYNAPEAEMVAGFFNYLVINGVQPDSITVLTYYNGQRKLLLKELSRRVTSIATPYFKVYTVDAYQGEENEVILLSLNRVVVALSRAQRGLYIFGNALTIAGQEGDGGSRDDLWLPILLHLLDEKRYGSKLPTLCSKHQNLTHVSEPEHWEELSGGCHDYCGGMLPCGHLCPHRCHPTQHDQVVCKEPCGNTLTCGHGCSKDCGELCRCDECRSLARLQHLELESSPQEFGSENNNGHDAWKDTPSKQKQSSPQKPFFELSSSAMTSRQNSPKKSTQPFGRSTSFTKLPLENLDQADDTDLSPQESLLAWNSWYPDLDKDISQDNFEPETLESEIKPTSDDLLYKETHKPVRLVDGKRIVGPPIRQIIGRSFSKGFETLIDFSSNEVATPTNPIRDEMAVITGAGSEMLVLSNDDLDFLEGF